MRCLIALSVLICALDVALGSQSNYNNFNKQQYQNIQSQAFGQHSHTHQQHYQPQQQQQQNYNSGTNRNVIPITSYKNEISPDGSYSFGYSTGNGIQADESGYLKNRGSANQVQVAQGSYSYTAPNGQLIQVRYIADELGFRAEGNHLPKSPPIPKEILQSLELIRRTQPAPATHFQPQNQHNQGQYNHQNEGQYNQHKYGK